MTAMSGDDFLLCCKEQALPQKLSMFHDGVYCENCESLIAQECVSLCRKGDSLGLGVEVGYCSCISISSL